MDIMKKMRALMETFGPSGYEQAVAACLKAELEQTADAVEIDRMGNVMARYDGTDPRAPVVMAYAHMDQLGFIVRRIDPDGFIQIDRLGGIPEKVLPGLNVCLRTVDGEQVMGVIGSKAHHAASAEEKAKVDPMTQLSVDIGATSAAEVRRMGIEIGCPATYRPFSQELAGGFVSGTAVDNRGALAALLVAAGQLRQKKPPATVYLVGTVWEEFNLRGAVLAARKINPDITIALDVVLAGDTRDLADRYETACGKGPVLIMYTFHGRGTLNGTLPHEGLVRLTRMAAEEEGIPLQHFAGIGILTDSAYVQLEGEGKAALELGFPARYTHTPVEVANIADVERLGGLLAAVIHRIKAGFNLDRFEAKGPNP